MPREAAMLTAEVKINGRPIASISAKRVRRVKDTIGDFIGDRTGIYVYSCVVVLYDGPQENKAFRVQHDRRFGWQGLLKKIIDKIADPVICTMSEKVISQQYNPSEETASQELTPDEQ
jgi:hypothetical protein